jgi:hypothetical protein
MKQLDAPSENEESMAKKTKGILRTGTSNIVLPGSNILITQIAMLSKMQAI